MVLIVAIIGMIIIMVRERNRVLVIETEAQTIHRVQHNGNIVQQNIINSWQLWKKRKNEIK